jgi:hypothetical protein
MKIFLAFVSFCTIMIGCVQSKKDSKIEDDPSIYQSFGNRITSQNFLSSKEALVQFQSLKKGDTISLKFSSRIEEVCSKKGCWMQLPFGDSDQSVRVRFKDYGFFMPLDSKGDEVIVEGKAFVEETSIEELKHYAEDAGMITDTITKAKREFAFVAHGVLIKP